MKNRIRRTIAMLLIVVMLLTTAPLTGIDSLFASKASAAYAVGDHIEYGNYPQSKVTDESTIEQLDGLEKNWISYRYYCGTGKSDDGKMEPSDYMHYADIDTNGDGLRDYRAVRIDEYRPYWTGGTTSNSNTYQDNNGYTTGNIYYFKFEPISWCILDPGDGLVMTEKIIDSQAYNSFVLKSGTVPEDGYDAYWGDADKTYYANDYYNSTIRQWLNRDFYNTAFTHSQASNIRKNETLNNDCYNSYYPQYNSQASNDKVFLLSWHESFSTEARQPQGTDYAKSQGLCVFSGNSWWWLRSSGDYSFSACDVYDCGYSCNYSSLSNVIHTYKGVRPACRLSNLRSDIFQSAMDNNIGNGMEGDCSNGHTPYTENNFVTPTCTETGFTASTRCSVCGIILGEQEVIPARTHNLVVDVEAKDPTCTESGTTKGKYCTRCDYRIEAKEIPALGHDFGAQTIPATCTSIGVETETCQICGLSCFVRVIPATGHHDFDNNGKCDCCCTTIEGYNPSANCNHICHKGGISAFFYKIARFFWKLFKTHKECSCGVMHY